MNIQELVTALRSGDSNLQRTALAEIEKNRLEELTLEVLPLVSSSDSWIRGGAIETLGAIADSYLERVGPELIKFLFDPDDYVRRQAIEALGNLPPYLPAVEILIDQLGTETDELNRVCIAETLGYLGDARAIPALLSVLKNEEEDELVCAYAASSLGFLGNPDLIPTLKNRVKQETSDRVKMDLFLSCIRLGDEESLFQFKEWIQTKDEQLLATASNALSFLLKYQPTAFLKEHEEQLREVRINISRQMARLEKIRYQKTMNRLKKASIPLLSQFLGTKVISVEELRTQLFSGNLDKQNDAFTQIHLQQRVELLPELLSLLPTSDAWIRGWVVYLLGALGENQLDMVVPQLMNLLSDPDELIRCQSVEALGLLPPYPPAVVPLINRLLDRQEQSWVRVAVAEVLGYLGDARAIPALLSVLQNEAEDELICSYSTISVGLLGDANLIPALHKLMEQEFWEQVKADLLLSCIRLGDEASIPKLLQLVETANEDVVGATCKELAFLLEYQPTPFLQEHAEQMRLLLEKLQAISYRFVGSST